MKKIKLLGILLVLALWLSACSDDDASIDSGISDTISDQNIVTSDTSIDLKDDTTIDSILDISSQIDASTNDSTIDTLSPDTTMDLSVCAQTKCPSTIVAKSNWFETPTDSQIYGFSTVSYKLKFKNDTGNILDITEVQLWSTPDAAGLTATNTNFPIQAVAAGAEFDVEFTVDLTPITNCTTGVGMAIRLISTQMGTMMPSAVPFVSVTDINCS